MNGARDDAFRSMYHLSPAQFSEKIARARGTADEGQIYSMQMLMENTNFEYITAEDGPLKIELRNKLQELVESWVCSTPISRKYYWYTIHMLVTRSLKAPQNAENPARKVADSFLALAKYAGNIFSNPWRPEFRQITLYGGFWFHEVGVILDNPNWILSKLGYAPTRENEHIWELATDISVETLGEIHWASLDCFVAAVECQMISRILNSVQSQEPTITLDEVIQYREAHVGSWEYAVQGLLYQARAQRYASHPQTYPYQQVAHQQWPQQAQQGYHPPQNIPPQAYCPPQTHDESLYYNHSQHQQPTSYYPPYPQPQQQPVQYHHPYQQYQQMTPPPPPPPPPPQQHYTQPYYEQFDPYHPHSQAPVNQFGQMNIKEEPKREVKQHRSESSSSRKHSRANSMDTAAARALEKHPQKIKEEKKKSGSEDHTWDYVYSDLSSKGYSKDLGSRPDILSDSKREKEAAKKAPEEAPKEKENGSLEWKCNACTFLNRAESNICSICFKSKDITPEKHPNYGPECPKCTFKNFVGRDYCDACGALIRPMVPLEDVV
ncbi:protein tamozhennic-like [Neocloeon triangulifer]|uniref:protein tamozhennic-like n=1 Tax=Neocloeon triangulifer TaxID=2078957 RepID=UPI00286EC092|nr:protein tamozhennic-like [Neocloeon triangulifer]